MLIIKFDAKYTISLLQGKDTPVANSTTAPRFVCLWHPWLLLHSFTQIDKRTNYNGIRCDSLITIYSMQFRSIPPLDFLRRQTSHFSNPRQVVVHLFAESFFEPEVRVGINATW